MLKSIHTRGQNVFLQLLRDARKETGVTQVQLAKRLRTTQSVVSKCERGERRIDVIELRLWCDALDVPFLAFVKRLEDRLS